MEEPRKLILSPDVQRFWIMDWANRRRRIILQDGQDRTEPFAPDESTPDVNIAQTIFSWGTWCIYDVTTREDMVMSEAYTPQGDAVQGRMVVYLDQNHWRSVALADVRPDAIKDPGEVEPARALARLVREGKVILPLSSAHMMETGGLFGDLRYDIGVAMGKLSRGWQMRHPMHVWGNECVRALADHRRANVPVYAELPVITLEPHALFDDDVRAFEHSNNDLELLRHVMSGPSVNLSVLLDPEKLERIEVDFWVQHNQAITDAVTTQIQAKPARRSAALRNFWRETLGSTFFALAPPGVDVNDFADLEDKTVRRLIRGMPMVSYLSELFISRYISQTARWKRNDLVDMLFLACAAGYADFVVSEKYTGTQLQQSQRARDLDLTVHPTLNSLMDALSQRLAQSA